MLFIHSTSYLLDMRVDHGAQMEERRAQRAAARGRRVGAQRVLVATVHRHEAAPAHLQHTI